MNGRAGGSADAMERLAGSVKKIVPVMTEAEKAAADACALVCTLRSWQARRAYGTELAMMPLGVIENLLIRRLGGIQGINGVAEFAGDLAAQVIAEAPAQVEPAQVELASVATENMEAGNEQL